MHRNAGLYLNKIVDAIIISTKEEYRDGRLLIKLGDEVILRSQTMCPDDGLQVLTPFMKYPDKDSEEHVRDDTEEGQSSASVQGRIRPESVEDSQVNSHKTPDSSLYQPDLEQDFALLGHSHQKTKIDQDNKDQKSGDQRANFVRLMVLSLDHQCFLFWKVG